jgi:hypothetical protein
VLAGKTRSEIDTAFVTTSTKAAQLLKWTRPLFGVIVVIVIIEVVIVVFDMDSYIVEFIIERLVLVVSFLFKVVVEVVIKVVEIIHAVGVVLVLEIRDVALLVRHDNVCRWDVWRWDVWRWDVWRWDVWRWDDRRWDDRRWDDRRWDDRRWDDRRWDDRRWDDRLGDRRRLKVVAQNVGNAGRRTVRFGQLIQSHSFTPTPLLYARGHRIDSLGPSLPRS